MRLTKYEEEMLHGNKGYPCQRAMEILIAVGEVFGAKEMIEISSCHMPSVGIKVAGDAGVSFVEQLLLKGGKYVVPTTTNISAIDPLLWRELCISEDIAEQQAKFTQIHKDLGALTCNTCTPYLIGFVPRIGEHIASGESSNVVFMNSVLGARTNREGAPTALAAALTGRVPLYGLHLKKNRYANVLVSVKTELKEQIDFDCLGYYVGKTMPQCVPVFEGIKGNVTLDNLKYLGAALNTSGAIPLFHVAGITPEAPTAKVALNGRQPKELLEVTKDNLSKVETFLNQAEDNVVNWIVIGCPHSSILEIREIVHLLRNRKVKDDVDFWICTNEPIRQYAKRLGYTNILNKSGVKIVAEMCPVSAYTDNYINKHRCNSMVTNSAKLAHYCKGECGVLPLFGSLSKCVEASIIGKWGGV